MKMFFVNNLDGDDVAINPRKVCFIQPDQKEGAERVHTVIYMEVGQTYFTIRTYTDIGEVTRQVNNALEL